MQRERIEQIRQLIVVGSGKGGVGKSTVSVNLAIALARQGVSVGLLDGDTYGPSVPLMLGIRRRDESHGWQNTLPVATRQKLPAQQRLQPLLRYGVKVMSVGFFLGGEQAVAPMPDMQGMLIRQLLFAVNWGELDVLLVDLPPGNGEPQATLVRELHLTGALLVTTPQDVARMDTARALAMFRGAGVRILGLVKNMSGFTCPHCGEVVEIFPAGRDTYDALDQLPLLCTVPLHPPTATSGDRGQPVVVSLPTSPAASAFYRLATSISRIALAGSEPIDQEEQEHDEP